MISFIPKIALILSAFVIVPAYSTWWWLAKVIITEHAHWLGFLSLCIFVIIRPDWIPDGLIFSVATIILLMPTLSIIEQERDISKEASFYSILHRSPFAKHSPKTIEFYHQNHSLPIDFYQAQKGPEQIPKGIVIVIHGGGWSNGTRKDLPELNYFLADKGFHVAAISYRLAPQTTFPGPLEDVVATIKYLLNRSIDLSIDPTKVFILGRSAGGQLASLASMKLTEENISISGVITLYAPFDLIWGYENTRPWHIINGKESIGAYLGNPLSPETENLYRNASPVYLANNRTPPHLLIHSIRDDLVSIHHARTFAQRLSDLGCSVENVELKLANHGFDYFFSSPHSVYVRNKILTFLESKSLGSKASKT